ncbi:MAG: hypothetical protein COA85_02120 [Robiginitomaculum sp.]|nr:MAG: hypothetical protein COA85_02120 [Robiginitomaculum sp.]
MPDEILAEAITGAAVETGVAGALVGGDNSHTTKIPVSGTVCSNCHTLLRGRHCHHCGQVADTYHRPVWALFAEILEGYFGLDGRIWRTIPPLLFGPGKITAQYLKGIRQPYISPIRLFLLSSLIFFLTFATLVSNNGLVTKGPKQDVSTEDIADIQKALEQAREDLEASSESAAAKAAAKKRIAFIEGELNRQSMAQSSAPSAYGLGQRLACEFRSEILPDDPLSDTCAAIKAEESVQAQDDATPASGESDQAVDVHADVYVEAPALAGLSVETKRFIANNLETAVNNPAQYLAALSRWAPRLAFILAPIYGLLLTLTFFWRRRFFIYDHMVVALHFHAFLFLFLVLLVPVGMWINTALAGGIFVLWSNIYLYRLIRRVYDSGRVGAVLRVFALDSVYLILLAIAFLGLLVLGIVFV